MKFTTFKAAFSTSATSKLFRVREKAVLLFAVMLITAFNSFGQKKEVHYYNEGISFTTTSYWRTVANDSIPDVGHYVSFERKAKGATGLITVTWMNKEEDPSQTILAQMVTMENSNIYRNPGIQFTVIEDDNFGALSCKSVNYQTIVKEQKLEGTIWCFNCSGRTIIIFYQSGLSDRKENEKLLRLMQNTFACR